jgi:hypothetical protein
MSEKPECCPTCNRYTSHGQQQLAVQNRSRPIYGTDFTQPLSKIIEGVRNQLAQARGQLSDIGSGFTGWRDRVENVEGLLTCGLIALHGVKTEMEDHERRYPNSTHMNSVTAVLTAPVTE